jgi:predicted AAA+ superfamily ATPase
MLSYWRTRGGEVDLIVGKELAIEIKSGEKIKDSFFAGLETLREENLISKFLLVSRYPQERQYKNICYLHYEKFLTHLWNGDYF